MEEYRAEKEEGAEPKDREQEFRENYRSILTEACENSSGSSNDSLRQECPELYNDYRRNVMKHNEYLEGGLTQVQMDLFRDRQNETSLTIRELNSDESVTLGSRVSEVTSSSRDDRNTTSSYSTSSVDIDSSDYLRDNTRPMFGGIDKYTRNNTVSTFEEISPNIALSNGNDTVETISINTRTMHDVPSNISSSCEGMSSYYAMSSSLNGDRHMSDYNLTGTEDVGRDHLSSPLYEEDDNTPVRDYTPKNEQIGGRNCDSMCASEGDYTMDYATRTERIGGHSRTPSVGANEGKYGCTLDYSSREEISRGHLACRSMSTINEGHRQEEFCRHPTLKEFNSREFERSADRGVLPVDCSRDVLRQSAKSLEDVRIARPPLPKVSFYSFEQELSRCETALREAKAELREERKKQVVVDAFRTNLLRVDRMVSEEWHWLAVEAERLGPLNKMAAEWDRDLRGAYWCDQYYRDQQHAAAGTDFLKSYVRRLGDPEPCQPGEVHPPTI